MKKYLIFFLLILISLSPVKVYGQTIQYTVKTGDTLWLISQRYQVGLTEIIKANPQFRNPDLIFPGQKVSIPKIESKSVEEQVITLTNVKRQHFGLPPLKNNWELSRVARYKSTDMRNLGYFSHDSPTYGSPFTMIKNFGISYITAAENIAAGQQTPEEVVNAWMNSPGHRKNILKRDVTEIGVGYVKGGSYGHYWTQMFIGK